MSVASTYAEALFEVATSSGSVERVAEDFEALASALANSSPLSALLASPDVSTTAKKAALQGLFGERNPTLANFTRVVVDRGRTLDLPDIARAFADRVDEAEGRIGVEAITAIALPDDLRTAIVEKVTRETGRTPVLTERVDPDVIGGLILRVGSVMLDASVRRHLDAMHRSMSLAPIPVGDPA
ncbi:MAG: ATP synthase F1 subunit delta [Actinobacteria bacterium]|nr:ATP synthase F1 subunit delta [Actinomycetota bacterium]